MRRLLVLAVLLAFLPEAQAQDRSKLDVSANGEYRARFWWMKHPNGIDGNSSWVDHRLKAGILFRASEKLSAQLTVLHNANWGATNDTNTPIGSEPVGTPDRATGSREENFLAVNEAYLNWILSEDVILRVGRQQFQIADGYVIANNDWEPTPNAFEGMLLSYEADFGLVQGFVFKYREVVAATGHPAANTSASTNPEHNAYGLNFDLRSKPEWIKAANAHVIKNLADALMDTTAQPATVQGFQGQDVIRYGAHAALEFPYVDFKAWYAAATGKHQYFTATGDRTERDVSTQMYQAEAGLRFVNFMETRLFVLYHQDSGDRDSTDGTDGTYDPYFYYQHGNAGLMDLLSWGNLRYFTAGFTFKPGDNTKIGAMYHMFSLTEVGPNAAGAFAGTRGGALDLRANNALALETEKLGDEVDVWMDYQIEGGLTLTSRVGYFKPGAALANALVPKNEDIYQIMLEGRLVF